MRGLGRTSNTSASDGSFSGHTKATQTQTGREATPPWSDAVCVRLVAGVLDLQPQLAVSKLNQHLGWPTMRVLEGVGQRRLNHPVRRQVRAPAADASTDSYDVVQRAAVVEILPGVQATIWGYNGPFPGRTIVSRSGRRTVVRHRNELPVPVIVHLHGGRTPPEHDGYAGKYAFHCHNLEHEAMAMMGNVVTG